MIFCQMRFRERDTIAVSAHNSEEEDLLSEVAAAKYNNSAWTVTNLGVRTSNINALCK